MTRTVAFETPTDPTLFGPDQLRPRALLALSMRGFATWLGAHLVPYSRLVYDFGTGAVFTTVRLDLLSELRFADADWLTTTARVQVSESAKYLALDVDVEAPRAIGGQRLPIARCHADLRLVSILENDGLTAVPGTLPAGLFDSFEPGERYRPDRVALARSTTPPTAREVLAQRVSRGVLCRSNCEVADQWSFIEVVELCTAAREQLFLAEYPEEIRRHSVTPTRSITTVFHCPLYLFDDFQLTTRLVTDDAEPRSPVFVYDVADPAHGTSCATAWEAVAAHRDDTSTAATRIHQLCRPATGRLRPTTTPITRSLRRLR